MKFSFNDNEEKVYKNALKRKKITLFFKKMNSLEYAYKYGSINIILIYIYKDSRRCACIFID